MVGDAPHEQVLIVWNSKARNGAQRDAVLQALAWLEESGVAVAECEPASAEETAARAAEAPPGTLVVAAGGDGTVHAVAQGLIRRHLGPGLPPLRSSRAARAGDAPGGPALGIIPLGTANDLARSLGIPLEPAEAVTGLIQPVIEPIDVVQVSIDGREQWMVNVAAGGNTAEVTRRLTAEQKRLWGAWSYVRGVLEVAVDLQDYPLTVALDDSPPLALSAFNVVIANGRTAATLEVAGRADLQDGLLEVVVVKEDTLVQTAGVAAQFFAGDYLESEQVVYRRASRVRLECEGAIGFSIDGEVCTGRVFEFAARPAVLPAVVGEGFAARRG